jgi:competence protein ComEC
LIWRRPWRLWGLAVIGIGIALTSIHEKADVLVDRDAKVVAIRDTAGKLQAPKSRRAAYTMQQWLKADGDDRAPKEASTGAGGWQCDSYACAVMVKGKQVSFTMKPDAVQEDCERAAILVAPMDILVPCRAPKVLLDRGALWEKGAAAIQIADGRIIMRSASEERGVRPWAPAHRRREAVRPEAEAEGEGEAGRLSEEKSGEEGKE